MATTVEGDHLPVDIGWPFKEETHRLPHLLELGPPLGGHRLDELVSRTPIAGRQDRPEGKTVDPDAWGKADSEVTGQRLEGRLATV